MFALEDGNVASRQGDAERIRLYSSTDVTMWGHNKKPSRQRSRTCMSAHSHTNKQHTHRAVRRGLLWRTTTCQTVQIVLTQQREPLHAIITTYVEYLMWKSHKGNQKPNKALVHYRYTKMMETDKTGSRSGRRLCQSLWIDKTNSAHALNLCHQHTALFCESGESGPGYCVIQDEDGSHSHGVGVSVRVCVPSDSSTVKPSGRLVLW